MPKQHQKSGKEAVNPKSHIHQMSIKEIKNSSLRHKKYINLLREYIVCQFEGKSQGQQKASET